MSDQDIIKQAEVAYDAGEPIMTDEQYDALTEGKGIEQGIGGLPIPESRKIAHKNHMLSLEKAREDTQIASWFSSVAKAADGEPFNLSVQHKFDGFAVSYVYENGTLLHAVTRGDGGVGENVTQNARKLAPKSIPFDGRVELRGEVLMPRESLSAIFEEYGIKYDNTRNGIPGLVRRLDDVSEVVEKHCIFITYDVSGDVSPEEVRNAGLSVRFAESDDLSYRVSSDVENPVEKIMLHIRDIESQRPTLHYDIDGAVVKVVDNDDLRMDLGTTSHHPRWAIAFKYEDIALPTTLRKVLWNRGRTGKVTPVGYFDTVKLGSNVSRASMHNIDFFNNLDPHEGDTLFVKRSGDVIPYIESILHNEAGEKIEPPANCPDCETALSVIGTELVCSNVDCGLDMKALNAVQVLNVKGVAYSLISKLMEPGRRLHGESINDVADVLRELLTISTDDIYHLEGEGETSANKAVEALSVIWDASLAGWLTALGLKGVGYTTAQKILLHFKTLDSIDTDEIRNGMIAGLSHAAADSIDAHMELILKLDQILTDEGVEKWVNDPTAGADTSSEYYGKNIVVTGTFGDVKRPEIQDWLTAQGANIQGSVSKTTNILFAGDKAGTKLAKAASLNDAGANIDIRNSLPF